MWSPLDGVRYRRKTEERPVAAVMESWMHSDWWCWKWSSKDWLRI
jgi:hypothetical protein